MSNMKLNSTSMASTLTIKLKLPLITTNSTLVTMLKHYLFHSGINHKSVKIYSTSIPNGLQSKLILIVSKFIMNSLECADMALHHQLTTLRVELIRIEILHFRETKYARSTSNASSSGVTQQSVRNKIRH